MTASSGKRRILVTGGAGFIGSAVCRHLTATGRYLVVNVDKLTYSGRLESLGAVSGRSDYAFYQADICDHAALLAIMRKERVGGIMHLAAETHVDRSIDAPRSVLLTNVIGTFTLLDAALVYWRELSRDEKESFRFHHVSTDEVFGDLPFDGSPFDESSAYAPSSPYAASKASADHIVRAWHRTYGLPVLISNCSNNYGPFQFPEKLIPLAILNAIEAKPISVYGTGSNVRDWLFVEDHAAALELVASRGRVGETYLVGGRAERRNLDVVEAICDLVDARRPRERSRRELIAFAPDRPGHDRRYAVDPAKVERCLGWRTRSTFEEGLARTVDWYLDNESWWRPIREEKYAGERLGSAA